MTPSTSKFLYLGHDLGREGTMLNIESSLGVDKQKN